MPKPEDQSKYDAQDERNYKKPPRFGDSYEHHRDDANHNDKPDGMARELTAAVRAIGHNPGWHWLCFVQRSFSLRAQAEGRPLVHQKHTMLSVLSMQIFVIDRRVA